MPALTPQSNANLSQQNVSHEHHELPVIPASHLEHRDNSHTNTEMTLHDILSILNRRKWIILSTLLVMLALTLLYTFSLKPSYRANAIVQIEREGAQIVNFGQTSKATGVFDADKDPFFRTRYEMLKGRKIAQKVIQELNLYKSLAPGKQSPSFFSLSGLKQFLGFKTAANSNINAPVDYTGLFLKRLLVQPVDGTHLVEVFYEAPTADEAKQVVTSLLNNFIKTQIETKSETGEYAKNFLTRQLAETREKLRKSEEALVKYANEKGILGVDDKQTRHVKKLENLDTALVQAEIKRIEAESLYQQMKSAGSVSAVLSNPVITSLKARLVQLEGNYQEMLKTFKPNYPDMVRLRQQINSARSKLSKEMRNIQTSMRADYLAAKRQEDKIRKELRQFNRKMHNLQDSSLDYNTLKREVDTNGKLYNNLLQRLEEVNVASEANTSSISIVEPAITPFQQYRPKPKLNILIGLIAGLLLGLAFAFLREALDRSVKSPEDLEKLTGLPVLGLIPKINKGNIKKHLSMITTEMPQSSAAEAYRISSTNIRFMVQNQSNHVLLVTSAHPKEGKSTTAVNLACTYAKMGMKVLLVDADIRNSSLHAKLTIKNKLGLSNYLKGEIDLVGITQPVNQVPGLYAITAGDYDEDPITLISHERMSYLTTQGAAIFDYVIIDSPPVQGFADTLILSSLATSTIIVAKEGMLESKTIQQILKQLARVKNNVLGFLLVDVKKPVTDNKYYSRYHKKRTQQRLIQADKKINFA